MPKYLTPPGVRAPFAAYSHAVEVEAGSRLVFCSGQLGVSVEDHVPEGAGEQAELCFSAIETILASAGMTLGNVVRINAYVTAREHMRPYMDVRDRLFPAPSPASTLMIVSGFTREEFKVEVEVVAAG
jgi:enamine deaminase RidA (YjgF/YER057c/UK114 family)